MTLFTFSWAGKAARVQVTGTFFANSGDFWKKFVDLHWNDHAGMWISEIDVQPGPIIFKFIVDGNWLANIKTYPVVRDAQGNENNQTVVPELTYHDAAKPPLPQSHIALSMAVPLALLPEERDTFPATPRGTTRRPLESERWAECAHTPLFQAKIWN
ncbi:hypothetical protein PAPYR_6484 [Paratrimastix pyriformis]|uniref:AMP-activated protein kinase glycogen-binding domain-containing protein n=1 Tax=Paratrimastix pyriformis TaxID=342808 RepID=A0ABQ8UJS1_9EUKA|nr:hypothetical protein PAPYR_6484 [Paratrimastix pyriformis]